MKFKTAALRGLIDKSLEDDKARHGRKVTEYREAEEQAKKDWVKENGPKWLTACEAIREKIKNEEPLTRSDLPGEGWYSARFYQGPGNRLGQTIWNPGAYVPPAYLVTASRLLGSVEDEEITTNGLKSLGFSQTELRRIFEIGR